MQKQAMPKRFISQFIDVSSDEISSECCFFSFQTSLVKNADQSKANQKPSRISLKRINKKISQNRLNGGQFCVSNQQPLNKYRSSSFGRKSYPQNYLETPCSLKPQYIQNIFSSCRVPNCNPSSISNKNPPQVRIKIINQIEKPASSFTSPSKLQQLPTSPPHNTNHPSLFINSTLFPHTHTYYRHPNQINLQNSYMFQIQGNRPFQRSVKNQKNQKNQKNYLLRPENPKITSSLSSTNIHSTNTPQRQFSFLQSQKRSKNNYPQASYTKKLTIKQTHNISLFPTQTKQTQAPMHKIINQGEQIGQSIPMNETQNLETIENGCAQFSDNSFKRRKKNKIDHYLLKKSVMSFIEESLTSCPQRLQISQIFFNHFNPPQKEQQQYKHLLKDLLNQ